MSERKNDTTAARAVRATRFFSTVHLDRLEELHHDGAPLSFLAALADTSMATVYLALRARGCVFRPGRPCTWEPPDHLREALRT